MKTHTKECSIDSNTISVLVVDDDPQSLIHFSKILTDYGYNVSCASNGNEALQILESKRFDVILCDMLMPHMSGLELLGLTRELNRNTIVIVMSAYADMDSMKKTLDLGASDYLVKPFSLHSIPITIQRNLLRRKIETDRFVNQMNKLVLQCIRALSAAMGAKEKITAEHCESIACYVMEIADAMDMCPSDKSTLELAAYMHDIGKIGISENILLKPDKLSKAEWEQIKKHPDIGNNILSNIDELAFLSKVIRHHHERIDGSGYPDGLSGNQIPLLSRILAVADAYDAMISDRPYRRHLTESEAVSRLQRGSDTQFDAKIVNIFVRAIEKRRRKAA